MLKYVYPKLGPIDLGFVRLSGPGLANCLFMAGKAFLLANVTDRKFIEPTWKKISIGPLLRRERDKRVYDTLFTTKGITGIKKIILLLKANLFKCSSIEIIDTIDGYFMPFYGHEDIVREYITAISNPVALAALHSIDLSTVVAVHVRLGDYSSELRIPLSWYIGVIRNIQAINPSQKFALFSDGSDEELQPILDLPNVTRHFYGNALADMTAISKCKLVIASDSTFSAWGAFLGNKPIIFNRRHFPPIYQIGQALEFCIGETTALPMDISSMFVLA